MFVNLYKKIYIRPENQKYLSRTFFVVVYLYIIRIQRIRHISHNIHFHPQIDNEIGRHISLTFLSRFLCLAVIGNYTHTI